MDFIVSYHLYNKIRKNELKQPLKNKKSEVIEKIYPSDNLTFKTCEKCGQDPYFCQCKENFKLMYHKFNPEKDKY
tara:strand:- start:631 stop:855 length:225 start_codon:yes stop_codon:yes gene_type:complete